MATVASRILWKLAGCLLLFLPVLPISAWFNGPDPGPDWQLQLGSWGLGLAVVTVIGLIVGRGAQPYQFPPVRWSQRAEWIAVLLLAFVGAAVSGWLFHTALGGAPQSIDEMAQLFQARLFLAGRLAAPVPATPEFFLFPHTWVNEAGWIQQFPPGHAALLAVGMALGAEWMINPVLGALSTVLVYVLAKGWYGRRTALLSAFLWAGSGWVLFMNASFQNHVTAVTGALCAWALIWGPRSVRPWHVLLCGTVTAWVAATRPLDAVVVALPVAVWMLGGKRWRAIGLATLGGLPVLALWFYVNFRLYGSPLTSGYSVLYGAEHQLGFHQDVYGVQYTPLIALSNMAAAFRRLHIYLFEWPIPAAMVIGAWAMVSRHVHPSDRYLVLVTLGAPVLYFFYWHSGFYPGPRFYYPAAVGLAIGTARAGLWGWKRLKRAPRHYIRWDMAGVAAAMTVVIWGFLSVMPYRYKTERDARPSLKHHPEVTLRERGVDRALVMVPESWGSRVIVDLWSLGVRPGVTERAFRFLDTCDLQVIVDQADPSMTDPDAIERRINQMLQATPTPVPPFVGWKDVTIRMRPDRRDLPASCENELRKDLDGYALYSSLAWRNAIGLREGVIFARDLYERNETLWQQYPEWPIYRFAPAADPDAPPTLTLIRAAEGTS